MQQQDRLLDRVDEASTRLGARRRRTADLSRQRELVAAFLAAARVGDFDALLAVLHPDVVLRVDAGPRPVAHPLVVGADDVASEILWRGAAFAPYGRPALVNGGAGIVASCGEGPFTVLAFAIVRERIVEVDLLVDPERLQAVWTAA